MLGKSMVIPLLNFKDVHRKSLGFRNRHPYEYASRCRLYNLVFTKLLLGGLFNAFSDRIRYPQS